MRAEKGDGEFSIQLTLEDKLEINVFGVVSCRLNRNDKQKGVTLVNFYILNEIERGGHQEEPGFHVEAYPDNTKPSRRKRYDVYISKERYRGLLLNLDQYGESCFLSRSRYGRVDIKYYNEIPKGAQLLLPGIKINN